MCFVSLLSFIFVRILSFFEQLSSTSSRCFKLLLPKVLRICSLFMLHFSVYLVNLHKYNRHRAKKKQILIKINRCVCSGAAEETRPFYRDTTSQLVVDTIH